MTIALNIFIGDNGTRLVEKVSHMAKITFFHMSIFMFGRVSI